MADATDLLNQIRQIVQEENGSIKKRLDEFREAVREEIKAETEPINQRLGEFREAVREEIKAETEPINRRLDEQGKKIDTLLSGQTHIETAMKTLATKRDVEQVKAEVDKVKKGLHPRHAD